MIQSLITAAFISLGVQQPDTSLVDAIAAEAVEHPFVGGDAEKTSALLVAVAYRESGGRVDAVGDGKSSFCAFQINLGSAKGLTSEGWTAEELLTDAKKCTHVAVRLAARSWRACGRLPAEQRLAAYARGTCSSERGQRISRDRTFIAEKALKAARKALEAEVRARKPEEAS